MRYLLTSLLIGLFIYGSASAQSLKEFPDSNRDNKITPLDALIIVNYLNANTQSDKSYSNNENSTSLDINEDGKVTPLDELIVINYLNNPNLPKSRTSEIKSLSIGSPEDNNDVSPPDVPSTPPLSPTPTIPSTPIPSPTTTPTVTETPTPTFTATPTTTPSLCQKNSCGFCPGEQNYIEDLGCGCGAGPKNSEGCCFNDTRGCDGACGSNSQIDACGVCGGQGNTCNQCTYSTLEMVDYEKLKSNAKYYGSFDSTGLLNAFQPPTPTEACLKKIVDEAHAQCGKDIKVMMSGMCRYLDSIYKAQGKECNFSADDCAYGYIITKFMNKKAESNYTGNTTGAIYNPNVGGLKAYFDKDCNQIYPQHDTSKLCEELYFSMLASPISLILDDTNIDNVNSISEFPLDIKQKGYVIWKASSKTPLLVYDPMFTNSVKDATQLFGSWTFGGKASQLASSSNSKINNNPWNDGFEALGTLDTNLDGEISGKELEPIALWFDKNQNGISEEGEVQRAISYGVEKLYFKNAQKSLDGTKITLEKGYSLTKESNKTYKLVDWKSNIFSTQSEALAELNARIAFNSTLFPNNITGDAASFLKPEHREKIFSGNWNWKLSKILNKSSNDKRNMGSLVLTDNADSVIGVSVNMHEVSINKPSADIAGVNQVATANIIAANKYTNKETNDPEISFTLGDIKSRHTKTIIKAKKVNNSVTLFGESSEFSGNDKIISYTWIATK